MRAYIITAYTQDPLIYFSLFKDIVKVAANGLQSKARHSSFFAGNIAKQFRGRVVLEDFGGATLRLSQNQDL